MRSGTTSVAMPPISCHTNSMNKNETILDLEMTAELIGFMNDFENADLNDCVDFICDKFNISATDDLIDQIADFFFAN